MIRWEDDDVHAIGGIGESLSLQYRWTASGGQDLDSRTAIVQFDPAVDQQTVGYSFGYVVPGALQQFTGDDTGLGGNELVMVALNSLRSFGQPNLRLRMRAHWYGAPIDGNITLRVSSTYGGAVEHPRYVPNENDDHVGYDLAYVTYHYLTGLFDIQLVDLEDLWANDEQIEDENGLAIKTDLVGDLLAPVAHRIRDEDDLEVLDEINGLILQS